MKTVFNHQSVAKEREGDSESLISLLREGNQAAFTIIYERYYKMLYCLALRYLKDKDMAEDAIQHVFGRLWENRTDTVITNNLRNYLYTVTKNYILNQIRNQNSAIKHNYRIAQLKGTSENRILQDIEDKELMGAFHRAIDALPEQKKRVCQLKLEGGLTNQEIAQKMNISINTVKTHYVQSLKMLRMHMDKILFLVISIIFFR